MVTYCGYADIELFIENCKNIGINCDSFVLHINDIDPQNIIIGPPGWVGRVSGVVECRLGP